MKDGKVRVIEVIPIVRGMAKDTLSYFTQESLEPGQFVKVPVRSSLANAIVQGSRDAKSAKSELRQAEFSLKKLSKRNGKGALSLPFMKAAEKTAFYYATTLGSILSSVLPKFILEEPELLSEPILEKGFHLMPPHEPLILQSEEDERYSTYRSIVRESFAKDRSVMFIVPTSEDTRKAYEHLSKGIQEFTFVFDLNRPKKELKKAWSKARDIKHPILFITTPSGLAFDRRDMKLIIVERENSRSYRTFSRPYINLKFFFESYARESRKQLMYGDSVLSVETLWKMKNGDYGEVEPAKWRIPFQASVALVDMKNAQEVEKRFDIFSPEAKLLFEKAQLDGDNVFIFGARKGLYPTTVCGDCATVISCDNCGAPVVLHEESGKRKYICHACGKSRGADTYCNFCHSWNLVPLGIGIDKIADDLRKHYRSEKIFILDKDHAKTAAQARKIAKDFLSTKGSVLVGTELAFLYLDKLPYTCAVSLDPLFSIPDFSVNEKIFYIATHIVEMATIGSIIQTRNIKKQILAWASTGNILDFYKSEIQDRESFLYSPYSVFIKVSAIDRTQNVKEKLEKLYSEFSEWKPDFVGASMIIRISRNKWPLPELVHKLSLLTPDFLIKVDPESIL